MTQPVQTANANQLQDAQLSKTERLCRSVADWTGAPIALMSAIVVQLIWIIVGMWTRLDPFPFVFLLTVSNVIQLILIFVIAVAQRQQSQHDQLRAESDHDALCRLLAHQEAQAALLLRLAGHMGLDAAEISTAVKTST